MYSQSAVTDSFIQEYFLAECNQSFIDRLLVMFIQSMEADRINGMILFYDVYHNTIIYSIIRWRSYFHKEVFPWFFQFVRLFYELVLRHMELISN